MDSERTHIVRLSGKHASYSKEPALVLSAFPSQRQDPEVLSLASVPRAQVRSSRTDLRASALDPAVHISRSGDPRRPFSVFAIAGGWVSRFAVLLLIPTLLIHPLVPAYAAEVESPSPATEPTATETQVPIPAEAPALSDVPASAAPLPEAVPEEALPPQVPLEDTHADPNADTQGDEVEVTATEEPASDGNTTDDTTAPATEEEHPPIGDTSFASTTEDVASTTPDAAAEILGGAPSATSTEETASSSAGALLEEAAAEEVTETPRQETPEEIASRLVQEKEALLRNELRREIEQEFTKGCVTMERVGYYCLKEPSAVSFSGTAPSEAVSAVSAQAGANGYKQISVTKGTATTEITSDPWDNAFPTTDLSGKSVVWQGNVNERWQIFFADVSGTGTPTVVQVTHASESNFNPRVDGEEIVWQGWVDGNWEIYLAERIGEAEYPALDAPLPIENTRLGIDRTWRVERITENSTHDMFPSIAGGLITWQHFEDGAWKIAAYSVKTRTIINLSQGGAKGEHPRFAITWDERAEDGSVRLMGYDLATGKMVDITGEARQLPDDQKPYTPPAAPITQTDQAALPPPAGVSTSTVSRTDDGDGGADNGLDI